MNNEMDISEDNISATDDKKYQLEFENEKDQKNYRKIMFFGMGTLIIVMFIVSFIATYCYIFHFKIPGIEISKNIPIKANAGMIVLISLTLMIPTILSLAMMRFLFGNNQQKDEKNIPSIVFNIGKELKETIVAVLNKKN